MDIRAKNLEISFELNGQRTGYKAYNNNGFIIIEKDGIRKCIDSATLQDGIYTASELYKKASPTLASVRRLRYYTDKWILLDEDRYLKRAKEGVGKAVSYYEVVIVKVNGMLGIGTNEVKLESEFRPTTAIYAEKYFDIREMKIKKEFILRLQVNEKKIVDMDVDRDLYHTIEGSYCLGNIPGTGDIQMLKLWFNSLPIVNLDSLLKYDPCCMPTVEDIKHWLASEYGISYDDNSYSCDDCVEDCDDEYGSESWLEDEIYELNETIEEMKIDIDIMEALQEDIEVLSDKISDDKEDKKREGIEIEIEDKIREISDLSEKWTSFTISQVEDVQRAIDKMKDKLIEFKDKMSDYEYDLEHVQTCYENCPC